MSESTTPPSGFIITQREVFDKVQEIDDKLDNMAVAVGEMVSINKRLDSHHERQNGHGERIRKLEATVLAQGIIIGIMTAAITGIVVKALGS